MFYKFLQKSTEITLQLKKSCKNIIISDGKNTIKNDILEKIRKSNEEYQIDENADITPLNEIGNGYAVFLISIPIIGALFIEPFIYSMFGYDTFFPILLAYAILNIMAVTQDEKQLIKANIKINNGLIWGALLVPVYCYLRGSALNKRYNLGGLNSQWVFICWIVSFFISTMITAW